MDRLLAKSPKDRYESAGELAEVLGAKALPPAAAPDTPVMSAGRAKSLPVLGGSAVLVARTTPSGAEVLVDGKVVGKTPLERSDIRAGERKVALRHPYYEAVAERGRRFDDGRVVQIERRLVRGRGALTVTTDPWMAWVEIGGERLAEHTPINMKQMPAGEVRLTLGAPGYRPLSVTVKIPKGGLAQLERELEDLPDRPRGRCRGDSAEGRAGSRRRAIQPRDDVLRGTRGGAGLGRSGALVREGGRAGSR